MDDPNQLAKAALPSPSQEFWEAELELPFNDVLEQSQKKGFWPRWIEQRTTRQLAVIEAGLGMKVNSTPKQRKQHILQYSSSLFSYFLVQNFAAYKLQRSILDTTQGILSSTDFASSEKPDAKVDTLALYFGLYHHDHRLLPRVLHLDKMHKHGFARMQLTTKVSRPEEPLSALINEDRVQRVLAQFNRTTSADRQIELKNILTLDQNVLVFLRGTERPAFVLGREQVIHGYRADWMILEFLDRGLRVNLCSKSQSTPLAIANQIASDCFQEVCEFENERNTVCPKQVTSMLRRLQAADRVDFPLVEVRLSGSPLTTTPYLALGHQGSAPIGPAITQFENVVGKIFDDPAMIDSIKVIYRNKRVTVNIKAIEDSTNTFEVRYSDHRLCVPDRRGFENFIRSEYGVPILSTEKRFLRTATADS